VTVNDLTGVEFSGRVTAIDSVVERVDAQRAGAGDAGESRREAAPRHVRAGRRSSSARRARTCRCPHPRSATRRSGLRVRVTDLQDPSGSRTAVSAAVRESRARARRFDSILSGGEGGHEASRPERSSYGTAQPSDQTNTVRPGNSRVAEAREQLMKFTDLFVKRPVLAVVVNSSSDAGCSRSARSACGSIRAAHPGRQRDDRVRPARTRISCALHYDAARARPSRAPTASTTWSRPAPQG